MDGKRVIGVDIGKKWLDVAREESQKAQRYPNEPAGIAALVDSLDVERDLVVFERCGGYERGLEAALAAAGIAWAVVHSARVKAFRQVEGSQAKTDAIDAALLQRFGRDRLDRGKLRLGRVEDVALDALVARRRQLNAALHAEHCRLETAAIKTVRSSIRRMIAKLERELAGIEAELSRHVVEDPQLALKEKVMCKRKGVAEATARGLLAELPELGRLDRKQITSLGALAPRTHQSGCRQKRRGLGVGRTAIRVILFNPARTAMRWDPEIKNFCRRLRAKGKPGKVIMVAVMRKMLVQLNAAVRDALQQQNASSMAAPAAS